MAKSGAIDIKKLGPALRKLGSAGKKAIARGALSGAMRGVQYMQDRTAAAGVFDRGGYRRGWKARPTANGAILFNDAPYAPVIEEGRRPNSRMPPVAVIERWVKRKGIGGGLDKIRGASGKNDGPIQKAAKVDSKGIAFAIARAIGKRGIKGKHLLALAAPALIKIVNEEVKREVQREVKRVVR